MVHLYYKGFLGPDEVGPPVVYRFDHSKEFEVVGIVVLFGGGESGQIVGHWMVLSQGGQLHSFILGEDRSDSILQCIGLEVEHLVEVRLPQDRFADHFVSKFFEGLLLGVFPVPWRGLLSEV